MKVLVIGKGGREHALAKACRKSTLVKEVFIAPGNDGMTDVGTLVNISDDNIVELVKFAKGEGIDLTIVGPESTLSLGVVDVFEKEGLKIFGPKKASAEIETSKEFAKKIMEKYDIPTGKYKSFTNKELALEYLKGERAPIVIKEDGLKAGKGVTVAFKMEEAIEAVELAFSIEDNKIVIEEYLDGFEFSIIALANGTSIIPLEVAQDHKRVFDGDKGPNTGGMGVYSPVDKITNDIVNETIDKIMRPMLVALEKEGIPFKGFLFGGIMLTKDGVKTIEFNARFGDPEAEGILPRLESDFVKMIMEIMENREFTPTWKNEYSVAVVLSSGGYPGEYETGKEITIEDKVDGDVYFMGVKEEKGKLKTNGGRVISVVCLGESLEIAQKKAYEELKKISFDKMFFRNDIGSKMCYNSKNK